jgi:two-component system, LytTR family, response regulator LytT
MDLTNNIFKKYYLLAIVLIPLVATFIALIYRFDKEKLSLSIKKFKEFKHPGPEYNFNERIAKLGGNTPDFKKRFVINLGCKIKSIETEKVACFFSIEKNTFLSLGSGNSYPVDFSLDKLETMLDPDNFFRINRQYLINYQAIEKMTVLSKSRIEVFISGHKDGILASTGKTHSFRLWLDR